MRQPSPPRLLGDHFADVQARDRERLARAFERDMRGIVRADEEVRAGRGELLRILREEGAQLGIVAALPRVEHQRHRAAGHGDFRVHVRAEPPDALEARGAEAQRRALEAVGEDADMLHSTVTLFARLRGWSTSVPLSTAT